MSRHSIILSTCSMLCGGALCVMALRGISSSELQKEPNPLGLNGSPYGEVLAIAVQGPIDENFRQALLPSQKSPASSNNPAQQKSPRNFSSLISFMENAWETRTNPTPPSPALRLHLRRQVEDRLRLAWQLDPSHYSNYNSLHFFLTEPELGTRPELTPSASELALETIQYCLAKNDDPRPSLTAAAAASNLLELMFNSREKYSTTQFQQTLNLLDRCLARFKFIANQWSESDQWSRLSPVRVAECSERLNFIHKFREDAATAISRFQHENPRHFTKVHKNL